MVDISFLFFVVVPAVLGILLFSLVKETGKGTSRQTAGEYFFLIVINLVMFHGITGFLIPETMQGLLYWGSDYFSHVAVIDAVINTHWMPFTILENPRLGFPFGYNSGDIPLSEVIFLTITKFLGFMPGVDGPIQVFNLMVVLSFVLIPVTFYYFSREMKLAPVLSFMGATLFNMLPYHFMRMGGHIFLSHYYVVPLALLVLFYFIDNDEPVWSWPLRQKVVVVVTLILGGSSPYYGFFFAFLLVVALINSLTIDFKINKIYSAFAVLFLLLAVLFVNIAPNIAYQVEHGKNLSVMARNPGTAEETGLKVIQMVAPIDNHRIEKFNVLKSEYNSKAKYVNENASVSLGYLISIGFLIAVVMIFHRQRRSRYSQIAYLNLGALLLSQVSGFGILVALFISPVIRAYNRMSVYIAALSLFMLLLLLNRLKEYIKRPVIFSVLAVLLLVTAVWDMTSPSFYQHTKHLNERYQGYRDFFQSIEAVMGSHKGLWIMPYQQFPEVGSYKGIAEYTHFIALLASDTISVNYGAMKGRPGDSELKRISELSLPEKISAMKKLGYGGILVDRAGYDDHDLKEIIHFFRSRYKVLDKSFDTRYIYINLREDNKK